MITWREEEEEEVVATKDGLVGKLCGWITKVLRRTAGKVGIMCVCVSIDFVSEWRGKWDFARENFGEKTRLLLQGKVVVVVNGYMYRSLFLLMCKGKDMFVGNVRRLAKWGKWLGEWVVDGGTEAITHGL